MTFQTSSNSKFSPHPESPLIHPKNTVPGSRVCRATSLSVRESLGILQLSDPTDPVVFDIHLSLICGALGLYRGSIFVFIIIPLSREISNHVRRLLSIGTWNLARLVVILGGTFSKPTHSSYLSTFHFSRMLQVRWNLLGVL